MDIKAYSDDKLHVNKIITDRFFFCPLIVFIFIFGLISVHSLNAGAVLRLLLGLKFVTLYHINNVQASAFSNSSYSLKSATGSRWKILPETIAAFAWILPEHFGDIVGWISRGENFSALWSWAHPQVSLRNAIWFCLLLKLTNAEGKAQQSFVGCLTTHQEFDLFHFVLLQLGNNWGVYLNSPWSGSNRVRLLKSGVLNLVYVCVAFTVTITVAPISDGDGKRGLAGRWWPAGSGQDLLEWRSRPIPTDTHWAQTEVQRNECRYWNNICLFIFCQS